MGGGQLIPAGLSCPHPDFWAVIGFGFWIAVNCFNNYKWICFTKYRYCLLVYINRFLEFHPFTGGGGGGWQHVPAGLPYPPPMIFQQWLAMDLVIAVYCFNNNEWICSTKYRYCLLVYKNLFLEIHPYTGGGQHIPAGLPYPPPKILERWLFTVNIMTFKYYIT